MVGLTRYPVAFLLLVVLVNGCSDFDRRVAHEQRNECSERAKAIMDLPNPGQRAEAFDALVAQTGDEDGCRGSVFWPHEPNAPLRLRYVLSKPFFRPWNYWRKALEEEVEPAIHSLAVAVTCGPPAPGGPGSIEDRAAACGATGLDCERVAGCLPEFGAKAIGLVHSWLRSPLPGVAERAQDVLCAVLEGPKSVGPYAAQAFEIWLSSEQPNEACRWALERVTGISLKDLVIEEVAP